MHADTNAYTRANSQTRGRKKNAWTPIPERTIYKLFGGNGTLDGADIELDGRAFQLGVETDTGFYYRLMMTLPRVATLTKTKVNTSKTKVAGRKSPLATKNLLEGTDGLRRPP